MSIRAFGRLPAVAAILGILLAGCTTAPVETASHGMVAPDIPSLTCAPHGRPQGTSAKLTSRRVKAGDPAYIEFRQRGDTSIPSGHLFVVFGRLDAKGEPASRQYIGLYPKGSILGLYGGAIVPMPADLKPNRSDCTFSSEAAFRVSLTESQYQALLGAVRSALRSPPSWHMIAFNCNHFAARLGATVGIKPPSNRLAPSFAYIHALIRANS